MIQLCCLICTEPSNCPNCGSNATCVSIADGFKCVCKRGFEPLDKQAESPTCVDIDECMKNSCHSYATCVNEPGSFRCVCNEGYAGDGFYCARAENVCDNIRCAENAHCIMTRNLGPRCLCNGKGGLAKKVTC